MYVSLLLAIRYFFSDSLKLRTVCNELEGVKLKAYEIGIQLGIPHNKMLEFEKEGNILPASINFWLCGNVPDADIPITWGSIVAALESKQVGEIGLARVIKAKYCCQQEEAQDEGSCKGAYSTQNQETVIISL